MIRKLILFLFIGIFFSSCANYSEERKKAKLDKEIKTIEELHEHQMNYFKK